MTKIAVFFGFFFRMGKGKGEGGAGTAIKDAAA